MDQPDTRLEGIDLAAGLQLVGGREALYRSLLRLYVTHSVDACAKIRAALEAGDLRTAERVAHSLKGSSGQVAAERIESAAHEIEQHLRSGAAQEAVQPLLADLEPALSGLLRGLRRVLDDPRGIVGALQPSA